ncbi:MAG: hypothetical protein K2Q03_05285 [Sphingobacteriaceae bacterium]|nr:hypothetical protein [Sphingobacteriaceae bacterium]
MRGLVYIFLFVLATHSVLFAQEKKTVQQDTSKSVYINKGIVEARKAWVKSAIIPGWGQLSTNVNLWSISKVVLIYGGSTLLAMSYVENNEKYREFLSELQYRSENNGQAKPGLYQSYPTSNLNEAKNIRKRNRQVVIASFFGVYAINIIDAYVSARLKYFNVDKNISMQIAPSIINSSSSAYAYGSVPALKITLKL